jgi:hypothetical protein
MRSFADVCHYEQELKTIHAEMQAAERRYRSVKTARHEKNFQMTKIYAELKNIQGLLYECRCKLRNADISAEDNENLRREFNSLSIKEGQVCQRFEQSLKECNMILHDDMDVLPTWLKLQDKYEKAQDQLKACRELEAQSLQATLSGEGQHNLKIANIGSTNAYNTLL